MWVACNEFDDDDSRQTDEKQRLRHRLNSPPDTNPLSPLNQSTTFPPNLRHHDSWVFDAPNKLGLGSQGCVRAAEKSCREKSIGGACLSLDPRPPPHSPITPPLADCADAAGRLASGPCAALVPVFQGHARELADFGSGTTCSVLKKQVDSWLPADLSTAACCESVRAFAADGCVCDPVVAEMLLGMRVLPPGSSAEPTIAGAVALVQAGPCSAAVNGGPILETCSGSLGCGPELVAVWDAAAASGQPAGA